MSRPKGSKNKSQSTVTAIKGKRGRPKGSKNKIKEALAAVEPVAVIAEEKPTEQIQVLQAVREFILQNFGKMSNDELAMKCNLTIRQVEDIATDMNQHFPDLKNEDKPQRIAGGYLKVSGTVQATETSGMLGDKETKKNHPKPKVDGVAPVRAETV